MKSTKILSALAFIILLAMILFLTFRPSTNVSTLSWMPQRWGLWLDEHDEFRHCIGFAVFAGAGFLLNFDALLNRSGSRFVRRFRSSRNRTGRLGAFLVLVYVLELAQLAVPKRDFDWLDIVNGWAGVLLAWGIWFAFKTRERRQRRRAHERRHEAINISSVRFR
ncbi:MAG TPA: hypothetical protein VK846_16190 [Candidatus Limnocylindria bacterium]|nr:hypothetical protein [Candidatus Limnocylindria bacterium]